MTGTRHHRTGSGESPRVRRAACARRGAATTHRRPRAHAGGAPVRAPHRRGRPAAPARLGGRPAEPHGHLRLRRQAGVHGLGRGAHADNPMKAFFSLPQVLGHEVVADVVALGPGGEGLEVGDRVVLNPWLSCGPRGVTPMCPRARRGDFSLCWTSLGGADRARHPHRDVEATATAGTRS